jgi:hypothetical protein
MNGLRCRSELEVANFFYAISAPELITLKGVFSVCVHHDSTAIPATKEKHTLHFMELHLVLVLLPDRITIFTDNTARLAEEEVPNHG